MSVVSQRPIFRKTAAYGHFGRSESEFTWEKVKDLSAFKKPAKAAPNGNTAATNCVKC